MTPHVQRKNVGLQKNEMLFVSRCNGPCKPMTQCSGLFLKTQAQNTMCWHSWRLDVSLKQFHKLQKTPSPQQGKARKVRRNERARWTLHLETCGKVCRVISFRRAPDFGLNENGYEVSDSSVGFWSSEQTVQQFCANSAFFRAEWWIHCCSEIVKCYLE